MNLRSEVKKTIDGLNNLIILRCIIKRPVIIEIIKFLEYYADNKTTQNSMSDALSCLYSDELWDFNKSDMGSFIESLVKFSDNAYAKTAAKGTVIPESMTTLIKNEFMILNAFANLPWPDILKDANVFTGFTYGDIINITIEKMNKWHGINGWGETTRYIGFKWENKKLVGIENPDSISFDDLVGYDEQRKVLINNTEKFMNGQPANNVLLYGDRGTGKSSMVKALLNKYSKAGLRMVEMPVKHLNEYSYLLTDIEKRSIKFIIFLDDLSFNEYETEYKHIKALLEGGLKKRPDNVLVYATSNRRHLIQETEGDRGANFHYNQRGEISPTDSMQEKISLADRFGIALTFISPNQRQYLKIVNAMAYEAGINMDSEKLEALALIWEKQYNGRSGRTARQFIDDLMV